MEDIILENMDAIFKGTPIREKLKFTVIRNADVSVDDETFEEEDDYRSRMMQMLKKRKRMDMVRVETSKVFAEGMKK